MCWSGGGINSGFAKAVKSKKTPMNPQVHRYVVDTDTFQRTTHSRESQTAGSTRRNEHPEATWQRLQHRFVILSIRGIGKPTKGVKAGNLKIQL